MKKKYEPERVLRGGSWFFHQDLCRAAARFNDYPGLRFDFIGFRLVRKGGTCNGKET